LGHPQDYDGRFGGTVEMGEILLTWKKSGATIVGRSPVGDFMLNGTSYIDFSS